MAENKKTSKGPVRPDSTSADRVRPEAKSGFGVEPTYQADTKTAHAQPQPKADTIEPTPGDIVT